MTVAEPAGHGWTLSVTPVGPVATLLSRLADRAAGQAVALGVDFPIGLPRAFVARHLGGTTSFPAFLQTLAQRPGFLQVADTLAEVGPGRPFYPRRGAQRCQRLVPRLRPRHGHAASRCPRVLDARRQPVRESRDLCLARPALARYRARQPPPLAIRGRVPQLIGARRHRGRGNLPGGCVAAARPTPDRQQASAGGPRGTGAWAARGHG